MADILVTTAAGVVLAGRCGDLLMALRGNWTSHLVLADTPEVAPTGPVTLTWHGMTLTGYVLHSGQSEGTTSLLLAGGRAGGLWRQVPAKMYDAGLPVRLPLQELLAAAGEQLAATSSPSTLQQNLPSWPRRAVEAATVLDELAQAAGARWRVLDSGDVFFGVDTWPDAEPYPLDKAYTSLSWDPVARVECLAPLDTLLVRPGQVFSYGRVARIHLEDDGTSYTARLWYLAEDGSGADDLVAAGLRALIREELAATDYHPTLGGQVLLQRPDGTLDVVLDDRRLPPLTNVRYSVPVPGAELTIPQGARVQLVFLGGDPRQFFVTLYTEPGGAAAQPAARKEDRVQVDLYVTTAPLGLNGATVVTAVSPVRLLLPPPAVETKITCDGKIVEGSARLKLP